MSPASTVQPELATGTRLTRVVLAWALTLALPLELLRGWGATTSASATMLALIASAASIGAVLYQLQLRHIQALLGRR